jgi:hypothetical protein
MGTFAETANVDYRSSLADQRKQTSVFCLKKTAIFLNPFSVCSLCKRNFVVCPLVYEETNGSYPFANRLNGLNGLARYA